MTARLIWTKRRDVERQPTASSRCFTALPLRAGLHGWRGARQTRRLERRDHRPIESQRSVRPSPQGRWNWKFQPGHRGGLRRSAQ